MFSRLNWWSGAPYVFLLLSSHKSVLVMRLSHLLIYMPQKLIFTYICIYFQDILPPHLFLFYSLCINIFCFQTYFSTQMILTLNVYRKSEPKEGGLVGGLSLWREVIFFLLYKFIYCKVHVHLVFFYCLFLIFFIYLFILAQ